MEIFLWDITRCKSLIHLYDTDARLDDGPLVRDVVHGQFHAWKVRLVQQMHFHMGRAPIDGGQFDGQEGLDFAEKLVKIP